MIARGDKANFFVSHYEWIVTGIGALALVGGIAFFASSLGADPDGAADDAVRAIERRKPSEIGVDKIDLLPYTAATRAVRMPQLVAEIADRQENFLTSEKRVKCTCGKVMPAGLEKCPACDLSLIVVNQEDEEAKKAEMWAKKFGVTLDDSDADGDGFTNLEEFAMGTNPSDAKSHADYLDSLKIQLPLKPTVVPFYLKSVTKIPAGFRCEFAQGKILISATVGEELVVKKTSGVGKETKTPTGFKLLSAEKKEKKVAMKGVSGTKTIDASVVVVERLSDGKKVELVVPSGKPKLAPIDVQATLVYERGAVKTFDVVTGDEIELNGAKYKVTRVAAVGKGAEVDVTDVAGGQKRTLKVLD